MKTGTSPFNPKVDVFMPLYIGRYLQDTTDLDATESGGYLHLLMYQWVSGPLPNSDKKLSRIAKMTPDAWSIAKASVMHFMFLGSDGLWHQRALEKIKAEWTDKRQKAHDKAVNAAQVRWGKQRAKKSGAPSIASAMPYTVSKKQEQKQTPPTPPHGVGPEAPPAPVLQASRPGATVAGASQNGKRSKSEKPGNSPSRRRQGQGDRKHPKNSTASVAPPPNFVAPEISEGVGPSKTDLRERAFQEEIFAYWRGQNPEHPDCPWGEAEWRALRALLYKVSNLSLEQFRKALRNRAASGIPPGVFPGKWLRNILDYSDGPLDRFHRPLRSPRVM